MPCSRKVEEREGVGKTENVFIKIKVERGVE